MRSIHRCYFSVMELNFLFFYLTYSKYFDEDRVVYWKYAVKSSHLCYNLFVYSILFWDSNSGTHVGCPKHFSNGGMNMKALNKECCQITTVVTIHCTVYAHSSMSHILYAPLYEVFPEIILFEIMKLGRLRKMPSFRMSQCMFQLIIDIHVKIQYQLIYLY